MTSVGAAFLAAAAGTALKAAAPYALGSLGVYTGYKMARQYQAKRMAQKRSYGGAIKRSKYYRRRKRVGRMQRGFLSTRGYFGRYNNGDRGVNEMKFFDTSNSFAFDATGEVPATGQLNLIPQGTTESSRIGRKCCIKSIQMRGTIQYVPDTNTLGATTVYLYLVLDKQCNGAAAAITDVLTSANMSIGMVNMANSERFVILKRFIIKQQAGAGVQAAFGRDNAQIEFYHKCNLPLEFSSTTGAITELKSNNLFLLAGTDTASDDLVTFLGTTRLRFSDN